MGRKYLDDIKVKVKMSLMIPSDDLEADGEVTLHINSCISLIKSTGVSDSLISKGNGLVDALVLIYCKTFYGFTNDGSVKELPSSFDFLLKQLVLTSED